MVRFVLVMAIIVFSENLFSESGELYFETQIKYVNQNNNNDILFGSAIGGQLTESISAGITLMSSTGSGRVQDGVNLNGYLGALASYDFFKSSHKYYYASLMVGVGAISFRTSGGDIISVGESFAEILEPEIGFNYSVSKKVLCGGGVGFIYLPSYKTAFATANISLSARFFQ